MTRRYSLSTQCRRIETQEKAAALGYASMIMFMCKRSSTFQMKTLDFWLRPAIDHQQIAFFFGCTGQPVGYVIWAHLAPDTEQRLLNDPDFILHPSEWNEGGRTWIIDACFPCGGVWDCITPLKNIFHDANIKQIFWARNKNRNTVKTRSQLISHAKVPHLKNQNPPKAHHKKNHTIKIKKTCAMAASIIIALLSSMAIEHWNLYHYLKYGATGLILSWSYEALKNKLLAHDDLQEH